MGAVLRRSGLILEVPEAESAVGHHREVFDASARLGVPAHVTVLFPFVPPAQIDPVVVAELRRILGGIAAFDFRLTRTAWFGDEVLWLAPEDPRPFRILTELVHTAFPDFPPYEGQFDDVVPHLTVADGCDLADMQAAERALEQHLPIQGRARRVTLMVQADDSGSWTRHTSFPLADPGVERPLLPRMAREGSVPADVSFRASPEDRCGITVDLRKQLVDPAGRGDEIVLVEAQVPVPPVERPFVG